MSATSHFAPSNEEPKAEVAYWSAPPIWAGETVCILGCGPSRNLVDMERLEHGVCSGKIKVVAINDSFKAAPFAHICYFCDQEWYETRESEMRKCWLGGNLVTMENQIPGVLRLRNTGPTGFDPDPSCLRHGSNSGYQAVHLSMHLGVKKIILCGYDMRCVGDQLHAEPRPERQTVAGFSQTLQVMLEKWPTIVDPLAERGIEVINASPGSALRCWPIVEPGSILGASQ